MSSSDTQKIGLRVTQVEKGMFMLAAQGEGVPLGRFIRDAAREKAIGMLHRQEEDRRYRSPNRGAESVL